MINIGKISMATKLRRFSLEIHTSCDAINQTSNICKLQERNFLNSNATYKQAQRQGGDDLRNQSELFSLVEVRNIVFQ